MTENNLRRIPNVALVISETFEKLADMLQWTFAAISTINDTYVKIDEILCNLMRVSASVRMLNDLQMP